MSLSTFRRIYAEHRVRVRMSRDRRQSLPGAAPKYCTGWTPRLQCGLAAMDVRKAAQFGAALLNLGRARQGAAISRCGALGIPRESIMLKA